MFYFFSVGEGGGNCKIKEAKNIYIRICACEIRYGRDFTLGMSPVR